MDYRNTNTMSSLLDDLADLGSDDELDQPSGSASSSSAAAAGGATSKGAVGSLADDLDDLSDGDEEDDDDDDDAEAGGAGNGSSSSSSSAAAAASGLAQEEARDAALEAQLAVLAGRSGYRSVARLRETPRFKEHMTKVEAALAQPSVPEVVGSLEEWPEYKLIVSSNALIGSIDDEYASLHGYVVDAYTPKFPELANIVPSPPDFIRVVRAIGNEMDMTLVDLAPLLPSATVMVVTVTGSVTDGKQLGPEALADLLAACDEALALEGAKGTILRFVESRMAALAPNVSALLGAAVAARLVGLAGGLAPLSRIPSCNIQVLGQKRRTLGGLSKMGSGIVPHVGVVYDCALVQAAPTAFRRKAVKVLSAKVVLAARVDTFRERTDGGLGAEFHAFVADRIRKMQEPPPGKSKRPLPAPDDKPSRKRGGRRARKLKEKLGLTDVRREANRLTFASTSSEYSDLSMGLDRGRLGEGGEGGGGKLRLERRDQKIVKKMKFAHQSSGGGGYLGGSSGATGGMASSMAFTPSQGLALLNPAAQAARQKAASEAAGYFSATGSFSVVRKGT